MDKIVTHEAWRTRVEGWRRSGVSAPAYADGKEFTASALHYWSKRLKELGGSPEPTPSIRLARVITQGVGQSLGSPVVLESGALKISVQRGFDRQVLKEILEVLSEREAGR